MDYKEFIENAIKTESVVDELNIDKNLLLKIFQLFIETTEILDAVKKQAFYGNAEKMKSIPARTAKIEELSKQISFTYHHLERGDFAAVKPFGVNTRVAHGVIGIATEAGELTECLYKSMENNAPLDYVNLIEELFDGDWYKAVISDECDIDWEKSWQTIIDKLKARFGEKFSEDRANNRDLDKERKILEN